MHYLFDGWHLLPVSSQSKRGFFSLHSSPTVGQTPPLVPDERRCVSELWTKATAPITRTAVLLLSVCSRWMLSCRIWAILSNLSTGERRLTQKIKWEKYRRQIQRGRLIKPYLSELQSQTCAAALGATQAGAPLLLRLQRRARLLSGLVVCVG